MSGNRKKIKAVLDVLGGHDTFVVACHVNPEGDALGSALGLAAFLEEWGKRVSTFCQDPVPRIVEFLPGSRSVIRDVNGLDLPQAIVVVDSSDLRRTGGEFPKFVNRFKKQVAGPLVNIDHHSSSDDFGDINLVLAGASSTCEILYEILLASRRRISPRVATCLYTGLAHDTGSFRFTNTTARTLETAARLVKAGANPSEICFNLYENQPRSKVELLALVIETLRFSDDGRRAEMVLTDEMFKRTGTDASAAEGFINLISAVEGVDVAMLFRQQGNDVYKVSFRANDKVDVAEVAKGLGGGGHRQAAGATVEGDLEKVRREVHSALDRHMPDA